MLNNFCYLLKMVIFPILRWTEAKTDTKKDAKRIKTDNFERINREKSNIIILYFGGIHNIFADFNFFLIVILYLLMTHWYWFNCKFFTQYEYRNLNYPAPFCRAFIQDIVRAYFSIYLNLLFSPPLKILFNFVLSKYI